MEREIKDLMDNIPKEERAAFIKKREEALKIASTEPKNFEIGSGNALMEVEELDESEVEERKDNNSSI